MRKQFVLNPSNKFRGTIDPDGTTRMHDFNGNTLHGYIDNDGYGTLHDLNGNIYRVRPE